MHLHQTIHTHHQKIQHKYTHMYNPHIHNTYIPNTQTTHPPHKYTYTTRHPCHTNHTHTCIHIPHTSHTSSKAAPVFAIPFLHPFMVPFCHKGGVIRISEVIDISPGNLDSSLCFFQPSVSHDVLCIEVK